MTSLIDNTGLTHPYVHDASKQTKSQNISQPAAMKMPALNIAQ